MRAGYKPRSCDWGIFSWPKGGPEYLGIPATACDLKEEAAAAILARWKGYYKIVPSPDESDRSGPLRGFSGEKLTYIHPKTGVGSDWPIHTFTSVHINDGSMSFSGGSSWSGGDSINSEEMENNKDVALKLALRHGVDGELYLDNLGSRVIEDSPTELKIKMFQGGEYSLVRTSDPPA